MKRNRPKTYRLLYTGTGSGSALNRLQRRVVISLSALAAALCFGTAGYWLLAGFPLFDAFYMALTTVTTIGYGEIHPMPPAARVYNVFYIFIGVTILLVSFGAVTQSLIELEMSGYFEKRRIRRMVSKLDNHFIVCGFGRVGRSAAADLFQSGAPFLVIDRNEDRVSKAMELGYIAMLADCTRDEILKELNIEKAVGLIAALATDADNLYLILTAKALNGKLRVATRVSEEDSEVKLRRAGADTVFTPYAITGHRLSQSLLKPHVNEFIDFATSSGLDTDVRIEQVRIGKDTELVNKTLRQTKLRAEMGLVVLAVRRADGRMEFNPDPDKHLSQGDHLIVMGAPSSLRRLETLLAERDV